MVALARVPFELVPKDDHLRAVEEVSRDRANTAQPAAPVLASANRQPPAVAIAQAAAQLQTELSEKMVQQEKGESAFSAVTTDRAITTSAVQTTVTAGAPPETARYAAAQIAVAVTNTGGKVTEIALNPEELGRVKLSLTAMDGAITLNVLAERPETQDLLRRHLDMLAQEFRDLGYSSISFSFGKDQQDPRSDTPAEQDVAERDIGDAISAPDPVSLRRTTGLDLRI